MRRSKLSRLRDVSAKSHFMGPQIREHLPYPQKVIFNDALNLRFLPALPQNDARTRPSVCYLRFGTSHRCETPEPASSWRNLNPSGHTKDFRTMLYILLPVFEAIYNTILLVLNILLSAVNNISKMVSFNPAKDIPSLAGKVILVTGGTSHPPQISSVYGGGDG